MRAVFARRKVLCDRLREADRQNFGGSCHQKRNEKSRARSTPGRNVNPPTGVFHGESDVTSSAPRLESEHSKSHGALSRLWSAAGCSPRWCECVPRPKPIRPRRKNRPARTRSGEMAGISFDRDPVQLSASAFDVWSLSFSDHDQFLAAGGGGGWDDQNPGQGPPLGFWQGQGNCLLSHAARPSERGPLARRAAVGLLHFWRRYLAARSRRGRVAEGQSRWISQHRLLARWEAVGRRQETGAIARLGWPHRKTVR